MGALGRAGARARQLSRSPNCAGEFVARSVFRVSGKPIVRTHVLVESAGAQRARGRPGTNARFTVAKRAMERCLHLHGRATRYGGGARLALSTALYYSVVEGDHCPARFRRKIF